MRMFRTGASLAALSFAATGLASAETLLLRDPAVSPQNIAFVYAGDLWIANRDGSAPRRLTTHMADEGGPVFSPDGRTLAYTATHGGNADVYTISVNGGQPTRHTWHPEEDIAIDWSPDGSQVAFTSRRETLNGRSAQLYHVALSGGLPEKQMEARLFRGRYDATGSRIASLEFGPAYNALYGGSSGWRGYRGGTTPSIQIIDRAAGTWSEIPGERVNDIEPMWIGDTVWFISDRDDKIFNIHRHDLATGETVKVTNETVWDIRAADADGTTIVYEAGGRLKSLDTGTGTVTDISVTLNPDLPQLRPQWKEASGQVTAADLSASGKRVAVTARGEVFSVPVEDGSARNISGTDGVREYSAIWSPDGTKIAYVVEADRRQFLRIEDQSGIAEPRDIDLGTAFYDLHVWGGEGDHIVYEDNHLNLYVLDVESGRSRLVSTGKRRDTVETDLSPDGAWLAYTEEQANFNRDLFLYNFASGQSTRITDGLADTASPAFSHDGKLLYFTGSTNSGPLQVGLDMTSQERPYRAGIYVAVLEADGTSPLLPKPGDEEPESDAEDNGDEEADEAAVTVSVDGLAARITALPVAEAAYSNLDVDKDGTLYFVRNVQPGTSNPPPGENAEAGAALMRFDAEEKKAEEVMGGITGLQISADGTQMMVSKPDNQLLVGKIADKFEPEPVDLSGVRMLIDPKAEWAQIFDDVWRMEKEHFYDPALHGLDWDAVYARYRPMLDHVGRREDLNALMAEMIAEMHAGHNRLGGGDIVRESGPGTGMLGADFRLENGRTRIARIYTGENWNPFLDAPLAEPGLGVSEGDYVLAVNGREIGTDDNIFAALEGTAGKQTILRVASRPDGRDARDVTVVPADSERMIRLWAWVEGNRKAVEEATDGRIGYVYLPNTGGAGYTLFNRMFYAQTDKDGMIIDERSNGGGQAANYITDTLARTYLSGWKDRDGLVYNTPGGAMFGPKVMLIDQDAGSGGDFLPYSFRHMGIGKLIGTRTWGGLIGISYNPGLVDGGFLTVPFFRYFDTEGNWTIENEGVAPDIEVALDPIAANNGRDTQLERAIAEVLAELETNPSPVPVTAPPVPTRLGD